MPSADELKKLETRLHALSDAHGKDLLPFDAPELRKLTHEARNLWRGGALSDADALDFIGVVRLFTKEGKDPTPAWMLRKDVEKETKLTPLIDRVKGAKAVKLRIKRDPERFITITKSARGDAPQDSPWQVTWFDKHVGGEESPSGHSNAKTIEAAVREAWKEWGELEAEDVAKTQAEAIELRLLILLEQLRYPACNRVA